MSGKAAATMVAGSVGWSPRAWERGSAIVAGVGAALQARSRHQLASVQPVVIDTASRRRIMTSAPANQSSPKILTDDTVFENLKRMQYAVRGPLLARANEIERELFEGVKKPFKQVIKANVGDAHAMGQKPVTFIRQVLALTTCPALLNDPRFPEDAKIRAKSLLHACRGGSVGAYSESVGLELVRKHIADYIEERDGIPADYRNIFLANGASDAIKSVLKLFNERIGGKVTGVMVPIPQYPLYGATLSEFGMEEIGYYLDEDNKWELNVNELQRAYTEAKEKCNPRVLVVINPGNPTGQVLSRANVESIVQFAYKNNLFIFADEVYQDNIYGKELTFHSFKKVMTEMGPPFSDMELASFMSTSKGYMGECGIRGGYAELMNMDPQVVATLYKSISAMLCPTVLGQITMDVTVNPPRPTEPSYKQFLAEKNAILDSLAERSRLVVDLLNTIPGYKVQPSMGAMYVFPRFEIPPKAQELARSKNMHPDLLYAFELLEETGICVVAGSGFGQKEGTNHFRTTILPQKQLMKEMCHSIKHFHLKFLERYS